MCDGGLPVLAESLGRVMHDAMNVVRFAKCLFFFDVEMVSFRFLHVGPVNCDVFVSVGSCVLVPEPECVHHFMKDCTTPRASLQIKPF